MIGGGVVFDVAVVAVVGRYVGMGVACFGSGVAGVVGGGGGGCVVGIGVGGVDDGTPSDDVRCICYGDVGCRGVRADVANAGWVGVAVYRMLVPLLSSMCVVLMIDVVCYGDDVDNTKWQNRD